MKSMLMVGSSILILGSGSGFSNRCQCITDIKSLQAYGSADITAPYFFHPFPAKSFKNVQFLYPDLSENILPLA